MPVAPTHFVTLATGQSIAIVAPLLATATPADSVTILASPTALQRGWVQPALGVLHRHGLSTTTTALADDSPHAVYAAISARPWPAQRTVVLGNGGTKLQLAALLQALGAARPALLYSQDRPCAMEYYPDGIASRGTLRPYGPTPLTLEDALALRGMRLTGGECLVLDGALTDAGCTLAATDSGYGFEAAATLGLHDEHYRLQKAKSASAVPSDDALPKWGAVSAMHPGLAYGWAETLNEARGDCTALDQTQRIAYAKSVFGRARTLMLRTLTKQRNLPAPTMPLGRTFEKALGARLCRFLARHQSALSHVRSVHANGTVAREAAPDQTLAELDLAILLRNGKLIAIEAKSHTAAAKDLDARLLNIQNATSQLAEVVICAPCYTAAAERKWFREQRAFTERLKTSGRFRYLPFTLPGQPRAYTYHDQAGHPRRETVPDFEDALEQILSDFAPAR